MASVSSRKRRADADDDHKPSSPLLRSAVAPQKRRRVSKSTPRGGSRAATNSKPIVLSSDSELPKTPRRKQKNTATPKTPPSEKRLRRFRNHPPSTFLQKLERAQTQRMIVISRTRTSTISEDIDVVGSTGNIYTVTIDNVPSCTCPDSVKGKECKHKVYALNTVLRAPAHLVYQLALLDAELEEIFSKAPPIPTDTVSDAEADPNVKSTRKPVEADSECPICYMALMEPGEKEELVWCKAACGNNLHKSCFDQWAKSQRGKTLKCVYCRTPWESDAKNVAAVHKTGEKNREGYVNVADQFGMSGVRDTSTYSRWGSYGRDSYYY